MVLAGKLIGSVNTGIAVGTEGSFVGTAHDGGLGLVADIALDLHVSRRESGRPTQTGAPARPTQLGSGREASREATHHQQKSE